jgi:recombination protein RecT
MSQLVKKDTALVVKGHLDKNKDALMRTLPVGFNYDRMCRTVINAISTIPKIAECTPGSIFLSSVRAFSLGLEPNGALNEGYLVPFRNKGIMEAVFMPSYRGLINLARRSGEISIIYATEVCEKDEFNVELGTDKKITHKPNYFEDRGKVKAFYAVFTLKTGESDFEVMNMQDIEKIKASSKTSNFGPWIDWYEEMAKKSVIKRLLKRAPMSIELASAIQADNKANDGNIDIIDIDGLEIPDDEDSNSKFEQTTTQTEKTSKKQTANKAMTLADALGNAPVTVDDIKSYCKNNNIEYNETEFIKDPKTIIEKVLNWQDSLI